VWIKFAGTSDSLKHMDDLLPHFVLLIFGRTKGSHVPGSKFGNLRVNGTKGTHLRPGIWVAQLVPALMKADGLTGGRLF
jgi:hypothetical protein